MLDKTVAPNVVRQFVESFERKDSQFRSSPLERVTLNAHGARLTFRKTVNSARAVGRSHTAIVYNAGSNGMGSLEKKKTTAPDVVNKSSDGVWEVDQK